MKQLAVTFMAASLLLAGDAPVKVTWARVPLHAQNHLLIVETAEGAPIKGMYSAWTETSLRVSTPEGLKEIPPGKIRAIQVFDEIPARRLRALRKTHREELATSRDLVFSHHAVAGLVFYGVTTGLRAASLPFCLLGDFFGEVDWSKPNARLELEPLTK